MFKRVYLNKYDRSDVSKYIYTYKHIYVTLTLKEINFFKKTMNLSWRKSTYRIPYFGGGNK